MPKYQRPRKQTSIISQLYSIYKAGQITYNLYNQAKKWSTPAQKKLINTNRKPRYQNKNICRKVRTLEKKMENRTGTHTYRVRNTRSIIAAQNVKAFSSLANGSNVTGIQTAMTNLRYYDAGTNTLVTNNAASGTYHRDIEVAQTVYSAKVRNNHQVPCEFRIYGCRPKNDTSVTTSTYYTDGLADQAAPSSTSPMIYLTDSGLFNEMWSIVVSKTKTLQPGQELSLSHSLKSFYYDPSLFDSHTLEFQKKLNGFEWFYEIRGVLAHATADANSVGRINCGVDIEFTSKYVLKYDAGKDLDDYSLLDNSNTMTTPLVSNKPVSDNQGYSLS